MILGRISKRAGEKLKNIEEIQSSSRTDGTVAGKRENPGLREIPVLETGPGFPIETLQLAEQRAHRLLDLATQGVPRTALKALDAVSRRWLVKWNNAHLEEIDAIAQTLDRPGAYFLSVNYEWACTCRVAPSPDNKSARLIRVLDWRTNGLGENICAARVEGAAGSFVTMTWPGYTGVLQAMAPGRFSVALNQAPMPKPVGVFLMDWAANRKRVWQSPHQTASHLLRDVCEQAKDFAQAKDMLSNESIAAPAIYSLAGVQTDEMCVIERKESEAVVHEGSSVAANHWCCEDWTGHERGVDSRGRHDSMSRVSPEFDENFFWLKTPILNDRTRLAMVADAAQGRLVARGYEGHKEATKTLDMTE